jgi:hypothetical protein
MIVLTDGSNLVVTASNSNTEYVQGGTVSTYLKVQESVECEQLRV